MSKVCTKCKQEKDDSEFYTRNRRGGSELMSRCKPCEIIASRLSQLKNGTANKYNNIRREFLWSYKSERGCQICGEKDYICLDFHHSDPEEKHIRMNYGKNGKAHWKTDWLTLNKKDLLEELNRVIVVCANCHRKIHRNKNLEKEI